MITQEMTRGVMATVPYINYDGTPTSIRMKQNCNFMIRQKERLYLILIIKLYEKTNEINSYS
jgi:hypothetical protein